MRIAVDAKQGRT